MSFAPGARLIRKWAASWEQSPLSNEYCPWGVTHSGSKVATQTTYCVPLFATIDYVSTSQRKGNGMSKIRIAFIACAFALFMGLCPGMALAASDAADLQAGETDIAVQTLDLSGASLKFVDNNHKRGAYEQWQLYYVRGKNTATTPEFKVILNGKVVPASAYTASYRLTYYDDDLNRDVEKAWDKPLTPAGGPIANRENMASEYKVVIKAKSDGGYTGAYKGATVCIVDKFNIGRYMDLYFKAVPASLQYNINPMNGNYYVFPQAKAKAYCKSLRLLACCSPGDGSMNHDGVAVASKYYSVTYYKARKDAVTKNISPASGAKLGASLGSTPPTAIGSYVMIVKGKAPYYGVASVYFDIQGSLSATKIASISPRTETGKYIEPAIKITYKGKALKKGVDYNVTFKNNLRAGVATAIITGAKVINNESGNVYPTSRARYFTGKKVLKFRINKHPTKVWLGNTMTAEAKTIKITSARLMKYGDKTVSKTSAFKVAKNQGAVTFEKLPGTELVKVAKDGKVTVAGHAGWYAGLLKDHTLKVKVKILAKGDSTHYAKAKIVTLKVRIV